MYKIRFFFLFILLFGSILFTSSLSLFNFSIIIFGFITFLIYTSRKEYIIILYIIFLPMSEIISSEYNIIGLIGFNEIISMFAIHYFFNVKFKLDYREPTKKMIKNLILLSIVILIFTKLKNIIIGYDDQHNLLYIVKICFKNFIIYFPLFKIISYIGNYRINYLVKTGVYYGIIILCISSIQNQFMDILNLNVDLTESGIEGISDSLSRAKGLFTGGDVNSFAGFLVIFIGYLLNKSELQKMNYFDIIILILCVYCLFITVSRTSFICLAIILFIYVIRNFRLKVFSFGILLSLIIFFTVSNIKDRLILRFQDESTSAQFDKAETGRLGKLIIYSDYILENPRTLIYGFNKPIKYNRAPHNFYINIVYQCGFIFFLITIILFVKLLNYTIYQNPSLLYFLIPFYITLLTVDSDGSAVYMYLLIPYVCSIRLNNNNKSNLFKTPYNKLTR